HGVSLLPRPASSAFRLQPALPNHMQVMHVLLVLIEDVADHAFATPAHDVVVLAAFLEMDFGAEVFALARFVLVAAGHEAGHGVGARTHLVDEVGLAFVDDLDADAAVLAFADRHAIALLAHFHGDVLAGWPHHFGDEARHMGAAREHHQVAQAALPVAVGSRRGGGRGDGLITQ